MSPFRFTSLRSAVLSIGRDDRGDARDISRISLLRTQGIAISVSSGCRPVSFKRRSAATGDRSPMSFVANGLRWMRSIAGPVTEPPPRVGAGPTVHGNGRPPVVPDGPPRRYGGGFPQERGVSERRGEGGEEWCRGCRPRQRNPGFVRRRGVDGASGGRRPSSPFRVILPSVAGEPSRSVRREVRMPASSRTIVRGWGSVLGLDDVRKAYDARRRASFRGRLLSVVSVALVVSGLVGTYFNMRFPRNFSWPWLHEMFGDGLSDERNFRFRFRRNMCMINLFYPQARFEITKDGVTLIPSRPAIEPRQPSRH